MVLRAPEVLLKIPLTAKDFLVRFWSIKNEHNQRKPDSIPIQPNDKRQCRNYHSFCIVLFTIFTFIAQNYNA